MSGDVQTQEVHPADTGLKPHEDARAIVRLFQCAVCSYPIRQPMTLPCGNSICRPCLPTPHVRENITYPLNADRATGFDCPFRECGMEHSLADCSLDVTLNKILEVVKGQVMADAAKAAGMSIQLDERLNWRTVVDSNIDVMPRSRVSAGGRLAAAFIMADVGELNYHSDLSFTPLDAELQEAVKDIDAAVAERIQETVRLELECHVCYSLMVDPITTTCGHTFCRQCVARVLDHASLCPTCRRPLSSMRPGVVSEPSNKRVLDMATGLLSNELAARTIALQEENEMNEEGWMPLFPCTLAFPGMPTFLHIFEPRYRLMIRRCIENGSRKFGMMMYNQHHLPQGSLGRSQYMQYGTVLYITRFEVFNDGRSLLETQGMHRFRVMESGIRDGYHIGRIQRVEDMPLAEEEAAEALETRGPEPERDDFEQRIRHMSTQALLEYGIGFIQKARSRSDGWLNDRVLQAYGQPPEDAATFPFWFASVLPINDEEKYSLLPSTSVRERLKQTTRWIRVLEQARW